MAARTTVILRRVIRAAAADTSAATDRELEKFRKVMKEELPKLNTALEKAKVPGVFPDPPAKEKEKK